MPRCADHPILPEEEIRELIRQYKTTGDLQAAERIIQHNERLINKIATYYYNMEICGDQEVADLMQHGRMGMMRAMETFDLSKGIKFITYAYNWVRLYIGRYGRRDGQSVYMSDQAMEDLAAVGKAQARFIQNYHRKPTVDELAAITGFTPEKVASLYVRVDSLDEKMNDDDTLGDNLLDTEADTAEEGENAAMFAHVMEKLKRLSHRDQQVIVLTFGLGGIQPQTLRQVASRLDTTVDRVSQIRSTALVCLRENTIFDIWADEN